MRISIPRRLALALFVTGVFAVSPAVADKPEWAGKDKAGKSAQKWRREEPRRDGGKHEDARYRGEDHRGDARVNAYFNDHHRSVVRAYYDESFRAGRCPPGLAKKRNGCLPPGHAKRWTMGRPLPRDMIFYDLPPRITVSLGIPPAGYRFVRVANDILLIAIGSGIVMDAIRDLGR